MRFVIRIDEHEMSVDVRRTGERFELVIDGEPHEIDCEFFGDSGYMSLIIDHRSYLLQAAPEDADTGRYWARVLGRRYDVDVLDELLLAVRGAQERDRAGGLVTLEAPMPGLIVDVRVQPGDAVEPGATAVIMEAMKMQNELSPDVGGVVREVLVEPGQTVDSRAPLVRIEAS